MESCGNFAHYFVYSLECRQRKANAPSQLTTCQCRQWLCRPMLSDVAHEQVIRSRYGDRYRFRAGLFLTASQSDVGKSVWFFPCQTKADLDHRYQANARDPNPASRTIPTPGRPSAASCLRLMYPQSHEAMALVFPVRREFRRNAKGETKPNRKWTRSLFTCCCCCCCCRSMSTDECFKLRLIKFATRAAAVAAIRDQICIRVRAKWLWPRFEQTWVRN